MSYDVIVIGAGHNSLVASAYLARAGLRTLVVERRERVGGTLDDVTLGEGTRCPAVHHSVGRLLPAVVNELGLYGHGLELIQPAVRLFAPSKEGPGITLWGDVERTAEGLRPWSPSDAKTWPHFDALVRALGGLMAELNDSTPPDLSSPSLRDVLAGLHLARALKSLSSKDAQQALRVLPMSVADLLGEHLESDALRAALATRGLQHSALGPHSAGTAAAFLSDCSGVDRGVAGHAVYVKGGPGRLAAALEGAARSAGAEIRTAVEVTALITSEDRVTGVALASGEEVHAARVVSGADPKRTLRLASQVALGPTMRWRAENIQMPGVTAKINLALGGLPTLNGVKAADIERLQGRIVIAPSIDDLERAFDASKYGGVSTSPYVEAVIPTLCDRGLAPKGRHLMSAFLQYAPYHRRGDRAKVTPDDLGDALLKAFEPYAPGLTDLVIERHVMTPQDLESDYGSTEGHLLHGEPTLAQFFAWRPLLGHASYRLGLKGLYLCGRGAHPGGDITGIPGRNAARTIVTDARRAR